MIRIEGLTKSFDGRPVVDVPALEVPASCTLVLVGPSGCGKSTLLRLIMGLTSPDGGEIRIEEQRMTPGTARSLRSRMGYVIQEGGLFPHLTARGNVALVASRLGWRRDRIDARIDELCRLVRLEPELLHRYPLQLSGGQRQRVSLMRALMLDPPVLLMDEPLGALDPMIRAGLQRDLVGVFQTLEKCVLFVTHDMAEAAVFGDEIALMRDGRIVQKGPLRALLEDPADPFVTEFIQAQKPPEALQR